MELGIGMFGDISNNKSAKQRLIETIEEAKISDQVGLNVFALGEHHRSDYAVSSPEMVLSAIASVTKDIKLASAVTVLSSSDPVKVYEDFATLDLLSDNRAEIMVGRGSFIESFPLFGYDLKDYEKLFEEKLDLLINLNHNEIVNWKGSVRAPLHQQPIFPRSEQKSGLPIWIAVGGTPASVVRAATLGLPLIVAIIGGMPIQFKPLFELYKKTYLEAGHPIEQMQIGMHGHTFISDDANTTDNYYNYYANQMNRIGRDRGWPPYNKDQYDFGRGITGLVAG